MSTDISFERFQGRLEELQRIKRYIDPVTQIMYYRTTLDMHARRVCAHLDAISPYISKVFGNSVDLRKARVLALVHDDHEIIVGDVQLCHKERMTSEERAELEKREENAAHALQQRWPFSIEGYSYEGLVNSIEARSCPNPNKRH